MRNKQEMERIERLMQSYGVIEIRRHTRGRHEMTNTHQDEINAAPNLASLRRIIDRIDPGNAWGWAGRRGEYTLMERGHVWTGGTFDRIRGTLADFYRGWE